MRFPSFAGGWQNIFFSFSAIQAMQFLLPLLALPWLGRILEPEAFGLLMYMCLFPQAVALIMEWGLTLGGARTAALARESDSALGRLLGTVLSAKILLACACLMAALALLPVAPHASRHSPAFILAVMEGICRGFSPLWFFQGTGRDVRKLALWEVGTSIITLLLIFICIRAPHDWPLYFLLSACCKGASSTYLNAMLWRRYTPTLGIKPALKILASTWPLFISSLSTAICSYGTQMAMGWFLAPAQMGVVVACGKMLRAVGRLLNPVTQTIFPHICIMCHTRPARARKILRFSLCATVGGLLLIAGLVSWLAPFILGIALGCEYVSGAPVLRIMIFAAPFMAFEHVLGTQTLVAFGYEKAQMAVLACAAICSLPLAIILTVNFGLAGAAWTPVCIGLLITTGLLCAVLLRCPKAFIAQK